MTKSSRLSLIFVALMVAVIGCDSAEEVVNNAKDKAADLSNIDFGDFDMKGMQEKLTGITDGFKDVSADSVDGLTSKITDLTGAMDSMGLDKLTGPAKDAVMAAITKFTEAVKSAMGGISDDGILAKLKPVVESLMEKIKGFK